MSCYHPSIEGAQHGAKSLADFLAYAKRSGAERRAAEQLHAPGRQAFQVRQGNPQRPSPRPDSRSTASARTARSGSTPRRGRARRRSARSSPPDVAKKSAGEIEKWAENYLLKLLDLIAELGVKVLPMFWGIAFGWEVATGYPWGFWAGPGYDLIKEGKERFVKKTKKIRDHARKLGIKLCHEIHPGTARRDRGRFPHAREDHRRRQNDGRERRSRRTAGKANRGRRASSRSANTSTPRT